MFLPSTLSPILRLQHRQWWHLNGRGEGGRHSDLGSPFHHKGTPKIPLVLQLLPTFYSKIQYHHQPPPHQPLTEQARSLSWTPAAKEAFETLKDAFTHAPILIHPDPCKPFIVEVDASTTGVGAILSQQQGTPVQLHPCAFFSWKLSPAERNCDIGNRELLAIKLALEEWRHWLEGSQHPFTVLTDHKNLQYLREAKRLNTIRPAGLSSSPGSTILYLTVQDPRTPKPMLYPVYTLQRKPKRNQNPSSPKNSLSAPYNGTPTLTPPPIFPWPLRCAVHQGYSMSPELRALPSSTPYMHPWALVIPGQTTPSRC